MKLSAVQKILFGLAVGLGLVIITTFLGIVPTVGSLRATASRIEEERIQAELVRREQQNDVVTERELNRLKSATENLEQYFIKETTILEFLTSLEQSASTHNVVLSISSLQPPLQGTGESQLELTARGTFKQLFGYVNALESLPAYFSIERLAWSGTERSETQLITLRGTIFWR